MRNILAHPDSLTMNRHDDSRCLARLHDLPLISSCSIIIASTEASLSSVRSAVPPSPLTAPMAALPTAALPTASPRRLQRLRPRLHPKAWLRPRPLLPPPHPPHCQRRQPQPGRSRRVAAAEVAPPPCRVLASAPRLRAAPLPKLANFLI